MLRTSKHLLCDLLTIGLLSVVAAYLPQSETGFDIGFDQIIMNAPKKVKTKHAKILKNTLKNVGP